MKNFIINDQDKKFIGILIKHYRVKNFRINADCFWTQDNFIYTSDRIKICSRKTLSLIEQGNITTHNSIYENLLNNIGYRYCFDITYNSLGLESISKQLYDAVCFYKIDTILELTNLLISKLKKYNGYIILNEYLLIFQIIQNYYNSFKLPSEEDINFILLIQDFIDANVKEILIDLVFKAKVRAELFVFNYYDFSQSTSTMNRINYILSFIYSNKTNTAIRLMNALKTELTLTNNTIRLIDILNIQISLYNDSEYDDYKLDVVTLYNLLKAKDEIPEIKVAQSYKTIAIAAYKQKEYDFSKRCLISFLNIDKRDPTPFIIILINIYQKESNLDKICNILKNCKVDYSNKYSIFLNYFIYKYTYNYNDILLCKIIVKDITKALEKPDKLYYQIFLTELNQLVDTTNRYKDLKLFMDNTTHIK